MSAVAVRRLELELAPGALAALKWLALVLMVVDHVDAFVYGRSLGWATALGRLVFPLFAFVLAYNLARPGALERGVYARVLQRLAVFGILALPFHAALTGALVPVNILGTFAVAVGVVWLLELEVRGTAGLAMMAALLFVCGGLLVEYAWPGVGLIVAVWAFLRTPTLGGVGLVLVFLGSLFVVNGSHAALWALPVVLLASRLELELPRLKWVFWAFYPLHLAAFWILAR